MTTAVFSSKLDTLSTTLEKHRDFDARNLADAITQGTGRHVLAVGSGGSAIAAEYLARCRDTLGLGPTTVQTPMHAVVDLSDLSASDVWLFSAGGNNPDAAAASRAAVDRGAKSLHLVTRNPQGSAASIVDKGGGTVHVVPVAEPKDGYLATHSLLSSIVAILCASNAASREPQAAEKLLDAVADRLAEMRDPGTRAACLAGFARLKRSDTLIIASDPFLKPLSVLLDTSIWEASLCHVQTTDFRNLAHGRHAWLHHRRDETQLLALTGVDTRASWSAMKSVIPESLRCAEVDEGACGRLENALAAIDGLGIIEAIGTVVGIDPGKPGIGDFGRSMYEDRSLADLAESLPPQVRHKRAAVARSDAHDPKDDPLGLIGKDRLASLREARVGGAVFDYDGTIVTTEGRWHPPEKEIIDELVRLHSSGFKIGFATGRGGSAGEDLRKVLPLGMLSEVLIGYYNGGHLRTADVDISKEKPSADTAISETAAWLRNRSDLFGVNAFKHGEVQISIDMNALRHPYRFLLDLEACTPFADSRVRVVGSGHSFDIIPSSSCKLVVVEAIKSNLPDGLEVLCFGDSGSKHGNDHALLSHRFGISVGDVCSSAGGCWSLFGSTSVGPAALLRIIRAIVPASSGGFRVDVASIGLDR